jgi:hypothetical protein
LGEALAKARELKLQPIGKVKARRERLMLNGRVLVTKSVSLRDQKGLTALTATPMMRLT